MKKISVISILIILVLISYNNAYAKTENESNFHISSKVNSSFEEEQEKGKDKSFFKDVNNSDKFMLKGVISSTSSGNLTIDSRVIYIDSSVTGDVKIVGNVQVGQYAMVQGIVKDSNYYATKIIIDQRDKKHIEKNEDLDASHSAIASKSADLENMFENRFQINNNLTLKIQNIINFLKDWLSKI